MNKCKNKKCKRKLVGKTFNTEISKLRESNFFDTPGDLGTKTLEYFIENYKTRKIDKKKLKEIFFNMLDPPSLPQCRNIYGHCENCSCEIVNLLGYCPDCKEDSRKTLIPEEEEREKHNIKNRIIRTVGNTPSATYDHDQAIDFLSKLSNKKTDMKIRAHKNTSLEIFEKQRRLVLCERYRCWLRREKITLSNVADHYGFISDIIHAPKEFIDKIIEIIDQEIRGAEGPAEKIPPFLVTEGQARKSLY